MANASNTVTVAQPIEAVFDFFADGTNNPRWRSGVISIERSSDATGLGATYRQKLTGPGGRPIDGDYEIDEFDRPNRLAFSVTAGPARPHGVFEFVTDGDGTRVTFTLDLTPKGAMKLLAGAIQRQMDSEVAALDNVPGLLAAG